MIVSVPVWFWQADLQASISLVFGALMSYPRELGLALTGMSMQLDRQPYNFPSIPTLQVLYIWWKLLDTLWGILSYGTYSTRSLASTIKVLSLTCFSCIGHNFSACSQPLHEQLCPVKLIRTDLNFMETSFQLESWGSMREAEACREDHTFPTCSLPISGQCSVLYIEGLYGQQLASSSVSIVTELCSVASCVLISDTRWQPMGN